MKNKKQLKAIQEFETFLLSDLPTKIFPMNRVFDSTYFREDYFDRQKDVEKYIKQHFKILYKQLKKGDNK